MSDPIDRSLRKFYAALVFLAAGVLVISMWGQL